MIGWGAVILLDNNVCIEREKDQRREREREGDRKQEGAGGWVGERSMKKWWVLPDLGEMDDSYTLSSQLIVISAVALTL